MADQQLDVSLVLEAFKERVAQLEYDLVVAYALVKHQNKSLEELKAAGSGQTSIKENVNE
jgi:hypothetical protein